MISGAISAEPNEFARNARSVSRNGTREGDKYDHMKPGCDSRLDSKQLAFLDINLTLLDQLKNQRKNITFKYQTTLGLLSLKIKLDAHYIYYHFLTFIEEPNNLPSISKKKG